MAASSKETLVTYLEGLGITLQIYEHPTVMTVEEQAKHVGHLEGAQSKNLFLKDKKGRFYLVSALPSTNVDLKLLSRRLGLGKGGLRMAPAESLQEVLKVSLGCVTPLALVNKSARSVALLLDQHFQSFPRLFFHPLTNDSTVALTNDGLDIFLKSIGKDASYVDLEAVVPIGKDHPPDLAGYVPSTSDESEVLGMEQGDALLDDGVQSKEPAIAALATKPEQKSTEKATQGDTLKSVLGDPQNLVKYILDEAIERVLVKVKAEFGDQVNEEMVSSLLNNVKEQFAPDLESIIVLFKNTAYTEGFTSGNACQSMSRRCN